MKLIEALDLTFRLSDTIAVSASYPRIGVMPKGFTSCLVCADGKLGQLDLSPTGPAGTAYCLVTNEFTGYAINRLSQELSIPSLLSQTWIQWDVIPLNLFLDIPCYKDYLSTCQALLQPSDHILDRMHYIQHLQSNRFLNGAYRRQLGLELASPQEYANPDHYPARIKKIISEYNQLRSGLERIIEVEMSNLNRLLGFPQLPKGGLRDISTIEPGLPKSYKSWLESPFISLHQARDILVYLVTQLANEFTYLPENKVIVYYYPLTQHCFKFYNPPYTGATSSPCVMYYYAQQPQTYRAYQYPINYETWEIGDGQVVAWSQLKGFS